MEPLRDACGIAEEHFAPDEPYCPIRSGAYECSDR